MTSILVPLITIPPVAPGLLSLPSTPCGCDAGTEALISFRCVLERGLSGVDPAPEANAELAEAVKAAAPDWIAQDLPAPYQAGGAAVAETPLAQGFAGGQVTREPDATLARCPELRGSVPEQPDREEVEPEPREQLPEASTGAGLPPATVALQPLAEFPAPEAPEQSLPEPGRRMDAPAAEAVQPLQPARKDPHLAFRLLLRPEQPQPASEAAPEALPQDGRASAGPCAALRPASAFEPHQTEPAAPAGMTPRRPERPSKPGTPEVAREPVPSPKAVAAAGMSRGASAEPGDTVRAQIKEVRVPGLPAPQGEGEASPPQEQRGITPEQPLRALGMAAAHPSGAQPKDGRETAAPASGADRELPSEEQVVRTAPARHVSVRVDRAGARPVDIGLVERAGRVEVSVRSADGGLNRALRENLGDLVGRLREEGFEAASWTPREAYGTERTEWTANGRGAGAEREGARESFERPGEQRHRKRPAEPWLDAFDSESERQGGKR